MCGRYSQTADTPTLLDQFDLAPSALMVEPRYNLAPGQMGPVAIPADEGLPVLRLMKWGLVPAWAKDEKIGYRLINARAETIQAKPAFRNLFKGRRCLVLADGFYEWRQDPGRKTKIPYHFILRGGGPFALAGLWDTWTGGPGEALLTYTIITTQANGLVEPIHPRMPVILDAQGRDRWLNPGVGAKGLVELLKPFDPEAMKSYRVSTGLNKPLNDHQDLILPVSENPGLFR